jgi:mitochondrial fission protein ELM1
MAGLAAWVITRDRAGNLSQARGLTEALGLVPEIKLIAPAGLAQLLAPYGSPPRAEHFGKPGTRFAPPWPPVAIGIGRTAVPYLRAIRRAAGATTFSILLMGPRAYQSEMDVVIVPNHDRREGANIISAPLAMHSFSPTRLEALRARLPRDVTALPSPRVTVVLGGRNKAFRYPPRDHARLARALASLTWLGCSFLVTPSRRSHPELMDAVLEGTTGAPRLIWNGDGHNPYPEFLAAADLLVVTGDSASMTSEAMAAGRPLFIFVPEGTPGKFARLHAALFATGVARPLPDTVQALELWPAQAFFATDVIAREVERRWRLTSRAAAPGV